MVKVKVTLQATGQSADFDLSKDTPIAAQLEQLCAQLNAQGNKAEYVLQLEGAQVPLQQQDLANVAAGAAILLKVNSQIAAQRAVEQLRDPKINKKVIFDLQKSYLSDEVFARAFLSANGLPEICKVVGESQGSALAYGLKALQGAMKYKMNIEAITETFLVVAVFPHINSTNLNVCKGALEVATAVAAAEKLGFSAADRCIRATAPDNKPYLNVVQQLSNADVGIQALTLEFINACYSTCQDAQWTKYLDDSLELHGMSRSLKKIAKLVQDEKLRLQMYHYQATKLKKFQKYKEIPYDKNNQQHEEGLVRLWTCTFPDVALQARVSEQWKQMGFQGTDPATDFRGMGYLGLYNLLYFAEVKRDEWKGIITRNLERKEREYPAAVAGINITQMLCELLFVGKPPGPSPKVFRVLFDTATAFEEMYCATFVILDRTWDEMNASYMDFPKVIAAVKKQVETAIDMNPAAMEAFVQALEGKSVIAMQQDQGEDDTEHALSKQIKTTIRQETYDMYIQQKVLYLAEGCTFKALGKFKEKESKSKTQIYVNLKADLQQQQINYAFVSSPTEVPPALPNSIKRTEIKAVLASNDCPAVSKAKKFEDGDPKRVFGLQLGDREVELLALAPEHLSNWTDGLRIWLGGQMQEKENKDELKGLTDMFLQVRFLGLQGITLPDEAPAIPPPPPNFDFVSDDVVGGAFGGVGAGAVEMTGDGSEAATAVPLQ